MNMGVQPMKDRIALVTGGSRGIGAATAIQLGQHGARVAVNYYRNKTAAQEVVETIESAGGKALAFQADVTNQEEVEQMVSHVRETLGPIDTLVLNAPASGAGLPLLRLLPTNSFRRSSLLSQQVIGAFWSHLFEVNYKLHTIQARRFFLI